MTAIYFLSDWALRSSILILSGALLLFLFRVKDSYTRLAAWTAILVGSFAIPALTVALPHVPIAVVRKMPFQRRTAVIDGDARSSASSAMMGQAANGRSPTAVEKPVNWVATTLVVYTLVALALLLRIAVGLVMSLRLRSASRSTGRTAEGVDIRESDSLQAPVTLGIVRPVIVLPVDWNQWGAAKLEAVVAHEQSHIRRHDPAVQLLSAVHRALLWHSPLSWVLLHRIIRIAEEASDDAALAVTTDRAFYAEVLLDFMRRGVRRASWLGVPMSRYGRAEKRIHRILDGKGSSHGLSQRAVTAIVVLASPVVYISAAARPRVQPQGSAVTSDAQIVTTTLGAFKSTGESPQGLAASAKPGVAKQAAESQQAAKTNFIMALGYVAAYTVTIQPRVEGQLLSVSFKEGDLVQTGQALASIDPTAYQLELTEAEGQLAQDQAQLAEAQFAKPTTPTQAFEAKLAQIEGNLKTDQAKVDDAKRRLAYTQIVSPITGVAGLLRIDPGNIVHPGDTIVVINQLQPISVLFNVAEDQLPKVLLALKAGASLPTEAWDRDMKKRFAIGRLTGVDNQIDQATGTVKLKAVFDNKDHALFPNQFVNVRLVLTAE
jgi:RND family efflux transporter MFP subunit